MLKFQIFIFAIGACEPVVGWFIFGGISTGKRIYGAWHYTASEYLQYKSHWTFVCRSNGSSRWPNEIALWWYDRQQQFDKNYCSDSANRDLQFGRTESREGVVWSQWIYRRSGCRWYTTIAGCDSNMRLGSECEILSGEHIRIVRESCWNATNGENTILSTVTIRYVCI